MKRDAGFLKAQLAEHKEELSVARMEVERLQRELKEQAAMLSREHQHNQNDLSQRISAALSTFALACSVAPLAPAPASSVQAARSQSHGSRFKQPHANSLRSKP